MKTKNIYIMGVAAIAVLFFGVTFKILHIKGANILFLLSMLTITLVFVPLAIANNYNAQIAKVGKSFYVITALTFMVVLTGAIFKVMHWPGAMWLMMFGIVLPFVLFLPSYIHFTKKYYPDNISNFLAIFGGLILIAIFSVFLSLTTSKSILYSYADMIDEHRVETKQYKIENNSEKSKALCRYIDETIVELIENSEQVGAADLIEIKKDITMFNPLSLKIMESTKGTYPVMFENNRASKFLEKLKDYKSMINSSNTDKELINLVEKLLITDNYEFDNNGNLIAWEKTIFNSNYLIQTIHTLSEYKHHVLFIEEQLANNI